jgi:ABC-type multidrug transport system ATPase subunit
LEEVRKEYKNPDSNSKSKKEVKKIKVAVRNFTASFRMGEVFGLLGPNGAGKVRLN